MKRASKSGEGQAVGRSVPTCCWAVGDRVQINDGSEAHGDIGEIVNIGKDGLILVVLDIHNVLWPVTADEIKPNPELTHDREKGTP